MGSKSFPQELASPAGAQGGLRVESLAVPRASRRAWLETLWVFGLLEAVMWTPRSLGHSLLIALVLLSPLWLTWRAGRSRHELGLAWPSWPATRWMLISGTAIALAFPACALLLRHPVPASPDWPKLSNILPYIVWAFFQQFLLQSFFFVRMESVLGPTRALWASAALFTVAHLPNLPLTALTFFGALFFTDMFRRYRSIYPLGIVHALLGLSIAYTFPNSLMHHMRVGLSFWKL